MVTGSWIWTYNCRVGESRMSNILGVDDYSIEWLDEPKTLNVELKVDGKWYQGFLENQE